MLSDRQPLVFIDTAGCGFEEVLHQEHRSYLNQGEFLSLENILAHAENLLGASIGIISPYAEQVRFIRQEISEDAKPRTMDISKFY
ncbi:MAG: hypothetical protein IPP49_20150 [Saprospiraceae bacterium]|nr:hypothetical protein [Saprospiraceae bacterium]